MLNVRFIVKMLGAIFILETLFMLVATVVSFFYEQGDFLPLAQSSAIMFGSGLLFYAIGSSGSEHNVGHREGMLVVALTWIFCSFGGMLPYYIGGYVDTITDAFFETMSGFTTTGSTIMKDIESLPKGILFWRSLTQWQGGIGIIVFTVALLPIIGGGAAQMYEAETPGITFERFRPRITQIAKRLWGVYVLLTVVLTILLWLGPMNLFDAVNHAFTTMSTGGYSTKNTSIAFWNSPYVEYVITLFMAIGATNMTLIYFFFTGKCSKIFKDEEVRSFYGFMAIMITIFTVWIYVNGFESNLESAFRKSAFQVATLVSTTGFATADYVLWGSFIWFLALILMLICGCAGSTCGGIKMGRVVILAKNMRNVFKRQTHPHAILPVRMNGHIVSTEVVQKVMAFIFIYILLCVFSALVLSLDGLGFEEAIGATVTAIGNVGPGLGSLGPSGIFADIPDFSKWYLAFLMMVGRLEIFTILTILLPSFWKNS